MTKRIRTAYLFELEKALRTQSTYVGPVLVVLAVAILGLLRGIERDGASDYEFIAYATPTVLGLLGQVLILVYSSALMSSELKSGTIRIALVQPITRSELLAAKTLMGMTYALLLTLLVGGASWALAAAFGELSGVRYGGDVIYTGAQMRNTYLIASALVLVPQFAFVAYAIMVSMLTRTSASAISVAIGIWIVVDMSKYLLRIAPFVFTTYFENPWHVFEDKFNGIPSSWMPDAYYCVGTSVSAFVLFFVISWYLLRRRDLTA